MLLLEIGNIYTRLVGDISREVMDFCTLKYGYFIRRKGMPKAKYVDKSVCFLRYNSIPTGWAGSLASMLQECQVVDKRIALPPKSSFLFGTSLPLLRPYQQDAILAALNATRGIIFHPTGSGKTITAATLISEIGRKTLFVVPGTELLNQAYENFKSFFPHSLVAKYGGGKRDLGFITVITAASLYRILESGGDIEKRVIKEMEVLIFDECHHLNLGPQLMKNTWLWSAMNIDAYWRFGFTATPGKKDSVERRALEMATGRVIHEYSYEQCIQDGHIMKPMIVFHKFNDGNMSGKDWQKVQKEMYSNQKRNNLICALARRQRSRNKAVLILVNRVDQHGKHLERILGNECKFISGDISGSERQKVGEQFSRNRDFILISTVSGEGVDMPFLDVVIRASGGKSNRETIQKLGRVVRKADRKEYALLIDIFDEDYIIRDGSKYPGYLKKHSQERKKTYQSLGFDIVYQNEKEL